MYFRVGLLFFKHSIACLELWSEMQSTDTCIPYTVNWMFLCQRVSRWKQYKYRKRPCISHTFFQKIEAKIQLYWIFRLCCFYFFPNSVLRNRGCGLSMDAAYTRTFTVYYSLARGPYWEKLCPRSRVQPEAAGQGLYLRPWAQFSPIRTNQGQWIAFWFISKFYF